MTHESKTTKKYAKTGDGFYVERSEPQTTIPEIITWIDSELALEKYATSYDTLGQEAIEMMKAIRNILEPMVRA